jgi:TonB dependent receptor
MKKTAFILAGISSIGIACAQSLYYVGDEAQESIPTKWTVGANAIWDNNVTPGSGGDDESAFSINPYVGVSVTNISPQSTLDLYARVGANYYLDTPSAEGADGINGNGRVGLDYTHRFNERLRFASRNFVSYEMEPEYAYGISTTRTVNPYTYWNTDNSVGYRWTERVASYTGFTLGGYSAEGGQADRDNFGLYHTMRYQLSQRSVITGGYRYNKWTSGSSDSTNHIITAGLEHRFSPTSIIILNGGVQLRDVDGTSGGNSSPYLEAAISNQINSKASVRGFIRYSLEDYGNRFNVGSDLIDFAEQQTLRIGFTGNYEFTPRLSAFGGVDYIDSQFSNGVEVDNANTVSNADISETIYNVYTGLRFKLTDNLTAETSVNYTDSVSDADGRDYDRFRVNVGASYSF